jgi:hypothetical protein
VYCNVLHKERNNDTSYDDDITKRLIPERGVRITRMPFTMTNRPMNKPRILTIICILVLRFLWQSVHRREKELFL